MLETIEHEKCFVHRYNDHIIWLKWKANLEKIFELEDGIEAHKSIHQLAKGNPYVIVGDARNATGSISPEARNFMAHDPLIKDIRMAEALIVETLPLKLLANFYMRFHRPPNPVKVFNKFDRGVEWLETQWQVHLEKSQCA